MLNQTTEILLRQFALIGHGASHPHRLRILQLLTQSEKTVEHLADMLGLSIASTSAHLKVLRSACLVIPRREGKFIHYRLASDTVARFLTVLRELGQERMPEVKAVMRDFFSDPQSLLPLGPKELLDGVKQGRFVLLDVRPADEYAAGHIPGARSIPLDELSRHIKTLPKRAKIIAYCRGPYCVSAVEAVTQLRHAGLKAFRSPVGVAEFKSAGLTLSTAMAIKS